MGVRIIDFVTRRAEACEASREAHRIASRRSSLKCGDFVAMLETPSRTLADYVRVRNADRVAEVANDQLFRLSSARFEAWMRAMRLHEWVCAASHARYLETVEA